MKELIEYLEKNKIRWDKSPSINCLIIDSKEFCLVEPTDGLLFDKEFCLIVEFEHDNYIYKFGGNWYWDSKEDIKNPKLNEFRYLGQSNFEIQTKTFLGIRGPYEILNGSRQYSDWCKKAKFLGIQSLGICEKNTLAGVLKFQLECQKNNIKPIIGETVTVYRKKQDLQYDVKLFVKSEQGWTNLLLINKELNVLNEFKQIDEDRLFELIDDLFLIVDPKSISYEDFVKIKYLEYFDYYQLDTVEYEDEQRDEWYLKNLKKFFFSELTPISLTDAFYLEPEHAHIKTQLNSISGFSEYKSKNQYFKDKDDYFVELEQLFNEQDDKIFIVYQKAIKNELLLSKRCNFLVETKIFHLPNYVLTQDQSTNFSTVEDLFWYLIDKGLKEKIDLNDRSKYIERINSEFEVISKGEKLIDYFLILWDITNWCRQNNILIGIGRGSAGGCLLAYLFGITNVDPIKYDLLFERFLNENRIKKSLADIDVDFEGEKRDSIKLYMEQRFGKDNVCSVGTYGNLKLKMLFNDLSRLNNIPIPEARMMTSILDGSEKDGTNWDEIFKMGSKSGKLKTFIQRYPNLINDIKYMLMQPRSKSIHACATIVTPTTKPIYEWFPVRKDNMDIVSEWEGIQLDTAGFLKEDILGLLQLDKFANIIGLIKENKNIDINFYDIPLDDKKVYKYFHEGWNEDVFQFGTFGLKKFTKQLKPDSIEELSAANALYRPGAMKSNAHNDFIDIKFGRKKAEYDYMLDSVTKKTYGLYIYQEQTMLAAKILGNYTLTDSDMLRKVMVGNSKKQERDKFEFYKNKFIDGAISNGCNENQAEGIWNKLESFAEYGFNKSHSVAYAITGYISQWFKVNYPIEFWTTAFKYADEKKIPNYISEINKTGDIKIVTVDVNKSRNDTYADQETNTIYWSFNSVKQVAEAASEQLLSEFEKGGQYFSLEEFLDRHRFKGSKVNKSVIENLIICGAFDGIERIQLPHHRYELIKKYRTLNKVKPGETDLFKINEDRLDFDWWWQLQQKRLSSIAFFDYKDLTEIYLQSDNNFCPADEVQLDSRAVYSKHVKIGGVLVEYNERENKKGKWCKLILESNFDFVGVTIWIEQFELIKDLNLEKEVGNIILLSGEITYDKYAKENVVYLNKNSEILILN